MDPELTLEKAAWMVRQSESVGEQQRVLKGQKDSELDVNWMTSKSKAAQQRNPSSSCTTLRDIVSYAVICRVCARHGMQIHIQTCTCADQYTYSYLDIYECSEQCADAYCWG